MFERFTKPARTVVTRAESRALDAGAGQIRPEHLLEAVLDQEGCLAVRVLEDLGASTPRLRRELDARRRQYADGLDQDDADALRAIGIDLEEVVRRIEQNLGGLTRPRRRSPRFSRSAKKALALALREAVALRHNYIGTEHLLLGLAACEDRVVSDTLTAFRLDRDRLRRAVVEALRDAS